MARKQRTHFEGAIYHVIARGNNKGSIFNDADDKTKYLELVKTYKEKYFFEIIAYVLMNNHLHMLIRIDRSPLSKIMQGIQQCYTQYFNRKYKRVGHVFQQRYKAFLCQDDIYLVALIVYIHKNPERAGFPEGISYPWSSHKEYVFKNKCLVDIKFFLDMLHTDHNNAVRKYLEILKQDQVLQVAAKVSLPNEKSAGSDREDNKLTKVKRLRLTWEEITTKIINEFNVSEEKLLGPCRARNVVAARNMLIYEAITQEVLSRRELAERLQIDPARITRGYQKAEDLMRNKSISQS